MHGIQHALGEGGDEVVGDLPDAAGGGGFLVIEAADEAGEFEVAELIVQRRGVEAGPVGNVRDGARPGGVEIGEQLAQGGGALFFQWTREAVAHVAAQQVA